MADTESVSEEEITPILSESTDTVVDQEGEEVVEETTTEEEIPTDFQWSTGDEEPVEELATEESYATTTPVEEIEKTEEVIEATKYPLSKFGEEGMDKPFDFSDPSTWGLYKDIVVEENLMPSEER